MLTYELVRELFSYDPDTGILIKYYKQCGAVIGHTITYKGALFQKTAIIWLYCYGSWPKNLIDHKDRNRDNNKIENLREATYSQNGFNQERVKPYGHKGITFDASRAKKWRAQIRIKGIKVNLGRFYTLEEAAEAYCFAALEHQGEFMCL